MIETPVSLPFEPSDRQRQLVVLLAVLNVPLFVWGMLWHYQHDLRPPLREACQTALNHRPEFAQARVHLEEGDYLDARLSGRVATPELRRTAQLTVDAVPGARVLDAGNQLLVTSRAGGALREKTLQIEGYLPSYKACEQLIHLIRKERPELVLDTSGLLVSQVAEPVDDFSPAPSFWPAHADELRILLGRPPSLSIEKQGNGTIQVAGEVPGPAWKKRLREELQAVAPGARIEDAALRNGLLVGDAGFTRSTRTDDLLRELFAMPGAVVFKANPDGSVSIKAPATAALAANWRQLVGKIQAESPRYAANAAAGPAIPEPELNFRLYPSVLHMPGYRHASDLNESTADEIQSALRKLTLSFEAGSSTLGPKEIAKLVLVLDLLQKNEGAQLAVGGIVEPFGNMEANQKRSRERAAAALAWLVKRGLPPGQVEVIDFSPMGEGDNSAGEEVRAPFRRVEFLLR